MELILKGSPKEIAELVKEIQARQEETKSPRKVTIKAGDEVVFQKLIDG